MTVSMRESSFRDDRLFDEHSLGSMQPSDEWASTYDTQVDDVPDDERSVDRSNHMNATTVNSTTHEEPLDRLKESFFANQNAFVDYLSELVPTFSVEGSKMMDMGRSVSTATFSKPETKANTYGSTHSRCIIENPESIQERQDEQQRRSAKGGEDSRDEATTMSSVEEFTQISELTMDMQTVVTEKVTEKRFAQCSALPTISEVKEFDTAPITATCHSGVVKGKAQCAAATDTTTNNSEGNNDFLDFVFDLVEDAVCKPLKTSKQERKKVFMEAFHEESEKILKLAEKNGAKDPFRESSKHGSRTSSSRHSRTSTGSKRSTLKSKNSEFPMDEDEESATNQVETSVRSERKSSHSRMKIVDKPPLLDQPALYSNSAFPLNEELTLDWSKIMSLAEKQLEAEEESVASEDSGISEISEVSGITENPSMFQSVKYDETEKHDASVVCDESPTEMNRETHSVFESSVAPTVNTSVSTHTTLVNAIKDLRELPAFDSSSFEEESRFILTTTLFRYVKSRVPTLGLFGKKNTKMIECEERAFDDVSVASIPSLQSMNEGECTDEKGDNRDQDEEAMLRVMHYIAFFYAFVFWPSGVRRKEVPKDRMQQKSLLQLVNEKR